MAERTTRPKAGVDGVDILAVLEHKSKPENTEKFIVVVVQFRPPLGQLSLELPAGLIDEGESADVAAIRELAEETYVPLDFVDIESLILLAGMLTSSALNSGYHGELISVTPVVGLDAGMSSSNAQIAYLSVR